MSKAADDESLSKPICSNRRAKHEYELIEQLECGVVLRGSEVKSLRNRKVSLEDAYARIRDDELWLVGCDVQQYPQANIMNHEPKRDRKLLVHARELRKLAEAIKQKGLTLVPLSMYFKDGRVKVMICVARGKQLHDKREKLKEETAKREMDRAMSRKR